MANKDNMQRNMLIAFGVIVVVLILIFLVPQMFNKSGPNDIFQATLEGKEDANHYIYNGYAIVKEGPLWFTQIQKGGDLYTLPMAYDPRNVQNIPTELALLGKIYNSQRVYFTMDPEASSKMVLASIEVGRIIGTKYNMLNKATEGTFTRALEGADNISVVTCADSDPDDVVLQFYVSNETSVKSSKQYPYCVSVTGKTEDDVVRAADKLAYFLVGIIKPG